MSIYLGNLTASDLIDRLGLTDIVPLKEVEAIEEMRSPWTVHQSDKLHIYDIPFDLVCGSRDIAQKVFEILEPYHSRMTRSVQISIDAKEEA